MPTLKRILSNKPLMILGFAESVSGVGNWITMMAVFSLLVFKQGGTVAASSGVFLAGLVPTLVVSPLAGWLLDRYNRKYLMIACQVLAGVVIAGLIFTENLLLIYTLLALEAVFLTVMGPARQSVIPDLVEQAHLTKANAFLHQLASFIKIGAPMFAGFVLTLVSPHTAIILDVISFLVSAAILTRLPSLPAYAEGSRGIVKDDAPSRESGADMPCDEGADDADTPALWQYIKSSPRLSLLLLIIFLGIFVIIGFDVLAPVFIRDILNAGEDVFGLLIGLVGVGTLLSSTFLFLRKDAVDPWRDFILGLLLLGMIPLFSALAAFANSAPVANILAIIGSLLGGIGNGLLTVQAGTMLQILSPKPLLGRISGLYQSIAVSGQLAGLLITPVLVPVLLPIATYFLISTLLLFGVSLYGFVLNKRHTRLGSSTITEVPTS